MAGALCAHVAWPPWGLVQLLHKGLGGGGSQTTWEGNKMLSPVEGHSLTGAIFIGHFKQKTTQVGDYILQYE